MPLNRFRTWRIIWFAELIGLKGLYVDLPDALGPAWDQALAADRPVVLEVKTDPEVPPLPPHITLEEAKHLTEALVKGDPREGNIIKETAKQVFSFTHPEQIVCQQQIAAGR